MNSTKPTTGLIKRNVTAPANFPVKLGEFATVLASAKDFKTGSCGYAAQEKVVIDNQKYQLSMNLILVGSKPVEAVKG